MISLRLLNLKLKDGKPIVFFMKGLPGSGKSTISKSIAESFPNTDIVSKDEIRKELGNIVERKVCEERDRRVIEAINNGKNIIVDDTNFNPVHKERILQIAGDKARVEEIFIDTPIEECIQRDSQRPIEKRVGAIVIWTMFNRYLKGAEDGTRKSGEPDENVRGKTADHSESQRCSEEGMGSLPSDDQGSRTDCSRSRSKKRSALGTDKKSSRTRGRQEYTQSGGWPSLGNNRQEGTLTPAESSAAVGLIQSPRLNFGEVAEKFLRWRRTFIGDEDQHGWIKNRHDIWEFSWDAPCYDMVGRFIGVLKIFYSDQNPKGKDFDKWQTHDVGGLYVQFRGRKIWLGKANPDGNESVRTGYITEAKNGIRHIFVQIP
jgi:predicted kinase